jgi:hypothetical protein
MRFVTRLVQLTASEAPAGPLWRLQVVGSRVQGRMSRYQSLGVDLLRQVESRAVQAVR